MKSARTAGTRVAAVVFTLLALALLLLTGPARAAEGVKIPGSQPQDILILNAVGDCAHPVQYYRADLEALNYRVHDGVMPLLRQGDLNFINLESPITDRLPVIKKMFAFNSPLASLVEIQRAGFNLISLANNHIGDTGDAGIADTEEHLRQLSSRRPLYWAGAGSQNKTLFFQLPHHPQKIAFLAWGSEERVPDFDVEGAEAAVREASSMADIVLVSVHAGPEYYHVPEARLVQGYRRLIDAGASVVLGHHPHVAQGVELYGQGLIFYSLGNYSLSSKTVRHHRTKAKLFALMPTIRFKGSTVVEARITPLYVNNSEPLMVEPGGQKLEPTPFCPQIAQGIFAKTINDSIVGWSGKIAGNTTTFIRAGDVLLVQLPQTGTNQSSPNGLVSQ